MLKKEKGPKKPKQKEKIHYMNMNLDSLEELSFCFWCEELIEAGFIEKVERGKSYTLTDGVSKYYEKIEELKTKTKTTSKLQTFLKPSIYTPDFQIYWTEKGLQKFCSPINGFGKTEGIFINDIMFPVNHFTTVEVKGTFNADNMIRVFNNNKKFLYHRYKIFANLIIPSELFPLTFTPKEYMLTTKTKQKRKINFPVRSIEEYLQL